MGIKLRRPILVGGLGLTASLWALNLMHPVATDGSGTVLWGAIALGSGLWWLKQRSASSLDIENLVPIPVDRTAVENALSQAEGLVDQLAAELRIANPDTAEFPHIDQARQALASFTADLDRTQIRVAIAGGQSVGKTTLAQQLTSRASQADHLVIVDTPGLFADLDESPVLQVADQVVDVETADLVLFLTTGDLTSPEFYTLQHLLSRQQRVLLVFNKQDQYLPEERPLVFQQIRARMQGLLAQDDVVAIATAPVAFKVRQHQPDGAIQERLEQPNPDITSLTERLEQILACESQRLVLSTVLRQVDALKASIRDDLNQLRRDRALPLIEQSQWIAAAAAFANPVPSLDLLATAAVNTQLILDLSEIYQQKLSLQQAKTVATTLADLMVKLGLVELSSQAISPLLKSNALTFVAGGLLQGISAAYLTRVAGLSLIEYFQEQSSLASSDASFNVDRLSQKLRAIFSDNQRAAFLQTLVKQGISRLHPVPAPALPSSTPS